MKRLLLILLTFLAVQAQEFQGRVVRSMAELRALRPIDSRPMVEVLGYYTPGDGGGGTYVLTNTVAGTNAFGWRVPALGGTKSWQLNQDKWFTVKQFGARGNGIDNDTAPIQAAFDLLRTESNRGNLTNFFTIDFPVGYYPVQNLNLYTKSGCIIRGAQSWDRNRAHGSVLQPVDGTERHLLRVGFYNQDWIGNPVTNDVPAAGITIDGINFASCSNIPETAIIEYKLSDALLVFDYAYTCDVKNVQFYRGQSRAVRSKNQWETTWDNIKFDRLGDWQQSIFYIDDIYAGGVNTSAMSFTRFWYEICRGTFFETSSGCTGSDLHFDDWNLEWGLGGTVATNYTPGVQIQVLQPCLKIRNLGIGSFKNFKFTNFGNQYNTYNGTNYCHDAGINFGFNNFGNVVDTVGVLQATYFSPIATESGTQSDVIVRNVYTSYPVGTFQDVFYRFEGRNAVDAEKINFGNFTEALSLDIDRSSMNPPLLGYWPANKLYRYRSDWINYFQYDTNSLHWSRQVIRAERTGNVVQYRIARIQGEALQSVNSAIRFRIRAKAIGDATCTPRVELVYTDLSNINYQFPTITNTNTYEWYDCTIQPEYLNGKYKELFFATVSRGATDDGSFLLDGIIVEPVERAPVTTIVGNTNTVTLSLGYKTQYAHYVDPGRDFRFVFSGYVDGDYGTIYIQPAYSNIIARLPSYAQSNVGTKVTIPSGDVSTNHTVLKWIARSINGTNRISVVASDLYKDVYDFNPTNYGTVKLWFAARKETGLTDGQALSTITDFSSNSWSFTQGSGTSQPTFEVDVVNEQPAFRFDGINDFVSAPAGARAILNGVTNATIVAVVRPLSMTANRRLFYASINGAATTRFSVGAGEVANKFWAAIRPNDAVSGVSFSTTNTYTIGEGAIVSLNGLFSAGTGSLYRDGTFDGTGSYGATAVSATDSTTMNLGSASSGSNSWSGDVCEFIIWVPALADVDRENAEKALADIYNIPWR